MTSSFTPRGLLLLLLLGSFLDGSAYSAPAFVSDGGARGKPVPVTRPMHLRRSLGPSIHGGEVSPEEKEYVQVAERMRAADAAFLDTMRKASPAERRSLRAHHLDLMRPNLQRINELARTLRKNQAHPSKNESTGVQVEGVPQPSQEIAGKSLDELARLGVPVEVLHQRTENVGSSAAPAPQANSKN